MENNTKKCNICLLNKDIYDFYIYNKEKNKTRGYCKSCEKIKENLYYLNNIDKFKDSKKEYYLKHKQESKTYKNQWYLDNKERTKERSKELKKVYTEANRDKIKQQSKEYHERTKDKAKAYYEANKEHIKARQKKFREENWELIRQREKEAQIKKRQDPFYKLKDSIRNRVRASIKSKGYSKNSKTLDILGCSFCEFKSHMESKFEDWMNWDNYGNPKDGIIELNKTWDIDHIIPITTAKTEDDVYRLNYYTNLQPLCSYVNRFIKRDN